MAVCIDKAGENFVQRNGQLQAEKGGLADKFKFYTTTTELGKALKRSGDYARVANSNAEMMGKRSPTGSQCDDTKGSASGDFKRNEKGFYTEAKKVYVAYKAEVEAKDPELATKIQVVIDAHDKVIQKLEQGQALNAQDFAALSGAERALTQTWSAGN